MAGACGTVGTGPGGARMILLLLIALGLAAVLLVRPPLGAPARLRRAGRAGPARVRGADSPGILSRARSGARRRTGRPATPMNLVVQQLAALLKGGRSPARLWEEIWEVYGSAGSPGHGLSAGSDAMLA